MVYGHIAEYVPEFPNDWEDPNFPDAEFDHNGLPARKRYHFDILAPYTAETQSGTVMSDVTIEEGWEYNPETATFSAPSEPESGPEPAPSLYERIERCEQLLNSILGVNIDG
jgi:hypothetical protein